MKSGAKSISEDVTGTKVSARLPASVIVADDLSGACDAGVQFARRGLSTRVILVLSVQQAKSQVQVICTNSRRDSAAAAVRQIERLASSLPVSGSTLYFKKIDSTLRGHVGAECEAMMQAFGCSYAVVAPAYPAQGRSVAKGVLKVHAAGTEQNCDALELLRKQT